MKADPSDLSQVLRNYLALYSQSRDPIGPAVSLFLAHWKSHCLEPAMSAVQTALSFLKRAKTLCREGANVQEIAPEIHKAFDEISGRLRDALQIHDSIENAHDGHYVPNYRQ